MALNRPATVQKSEEVVTEEVVTQEGVAATAAVAEKEVEQVEEVQPEQVEETQPEDVVTEEGVAAIAATQPEPTEVASSTAVAESQPKAVSVANASNQAMAEFTKAQADQGFDGMDLTGMSFDRIKLHEGKFKLGADETEIGTEFQCVVQQTRRLYVVRQSSDQDAEAFYSYDAEGKTNTDGSESKLEEWKDDGYEETLEIKEYMEAMALLVNRDDEFEGMMVMLSIPPASRNRMAGISAQAQLRLKARNLSEVVIKAYVGKVVGTGNKAFKPWNFSLMGRFED